MQKFARDLLHLLKVFPPSPDEKEALTQPGALHGDVSPTIDALGTSRFADLQKGQAVVAATQATVLSDIVPDDRIRFVPYAALHHTGGSSVFTAQISVDATTLGFNEATAVSDAFPSFSGLGCHLSYPIILRPGTRLRGFFTPSVSSGSLILNWWFVDLPFGEYVRY